MRLLLGRIFAAILCVLGTAGSVQAQTTTPTTESSATDADANARRLFGAGSTAFDEHRYEDALGYFDEAYALTHLPRLLYNIGLAAEHSGHRDRAVEAFQAYVRDAPDAENRLEVERRLAVLTRADTATTPPPSDVIEAPVEPPPPASHADDPSGWIVLGVGAGVFVAGAVMLGIGANDYASVTGLPDGATYASVHDAADRAPLLLGIGAACAAAGAVAAIIGLVIATSGSSGDVQVQARVGLDGLRIEGTF